MKPMQLLRTLIHALNGAEFTAYDMKSVENYSGRLARMAQLKEIIVIDRRAIRTTRKVEIYQATKLLRQPDYKILNPVMPHVQLHEDELPGLQDVFPDMFRVHEIPAGLARRPMPWVIR